MNFVSSVSCYAQFNNIYDLTLNSASWSASNLEYSTIGYNNTAEK